jgi:putative inorganic carbon (HCO3(-)) transporter
MPRLSSHVLGRALEEQIPREEKRTRAPAAATTEGRLNWRACLVVVTLAGVLAYTAFEWGGIVRTGRYQYLLVLGLLAMLLSLGRSREEWSTFPGRVLRWTAALLPAYVLLQVVPLPVAVLRVLSPARAEAMDTLGPVGAKVSFASLSVFPAGTFQYFLLVCGYMVIFLLVCTLTWRFENRRWLVIWPILGIAALEAGLGLWQYLGGAEEQIRWGTYANHDHYAGFLEMALPFAVMYPMALLERAHSRRHSPVASALAASGVWALAALIFAGIILSFSRMGFIATLFSLFVMGTLTLGTAQLSWLTRSRTRRLAGSGLVAALVLAGFVFLPPDRLIRRFAELVSTDGLNGGARTHLWAETIPLIKAYPVFGCGLDGYETAFSRFKIYGVLETDDFAHNDYLQLLAELGLVGFVIGAALAFSVVRMALSGAVKSPDPEARYFAVACVGALSAIGMHSLADFNLYLPANAMLLAWIAGTTVGVQLRETSMSVRERLGHLNATIEEAVEIGARSQTYG